MLIWMMWIWMILSCNHDQLQINDGLVDDKPNFIGYNEALNWDDVIPFSDYIDK